MSTFSIIGLSIGLLGAVLTAIGLAWMLTANIERHL